MIQKDRSDQPSSRRVKEGTWNKQPIKYMAGRVIVKFKPRPEDSAESITNLCDELAAELSRGAVLRPPRATGRAVFSFDPDQSAPRIALDLGRRDDVEYAEPDIVDRECIIPSDTRYVDQWAWPKVNAPAGWDLETGASNVVIGIIDSGISMTGGVLDHPDLNLASRYILGTDYVDGGVPRDLRGHGTHVAGIAAAESNNAQGVAGMNWGSPVYICRTLDSFGNGSSADFADAVEEIVDWALANGKKAVINYSAGGGANQTKQDACQYASDNGMILCAATGNDNAGPVIWPAAYSTMFDGVVAVGSTDDDDTVSSYSNVGPEVTVVAPGREILSTTPTYPVTISAPLDYAEYDGTSMATPLVSGLVALMWSRHPSFTNKKIKDCLTGTAVKLGSGTFNNAWGYGRVDAEAALRCGDFVFPTLFTLFTTFTYFTFFTHFTFFTRFTPFTIFTLFTIFTRFTRLTPFRRFTRFLEPLERLKRPVGPVNFVRVGKTVFELNELAIGNFADLKVAHKDLERIGVDHLHELAGSDVAKLAKALGYLPEEAAALVKLAKQILSDLAEGKP